jgi:CubicO group peptidase (beta-lactamase class C family)
MVVGLSSCEGQLILGFGAKVRFGSVPPAADDIFEIGSVTKVFTGYLHARALERGSVGLTDPIDPYFPAGVPHWGSQSIQLLQLATHTSGLPNYPNNLHSSDPANPAADYTAQDLASFLSTHSLSTAPGSQFLYSNLGSGMLGSVLVKASGARSFEALVQQEIAGPLSMPDTRILLSLEQHQRRIQGYQFGLPASFGDIGEPLAGGGALRSTARDLLAFFEPGSGIGPSPAVATWSTVLVPRAPSPFGVNGSTGLLINIEDYAGSRLYSKGGGTAGFTSQVAFTRDQPAVVVLLSNCQNVQVLRNLSSALLELLRK